MQHQLNLNLPATVDADQDGELGPPPSFNRGVVFLALAGLGWLGIYAAIQIFSVLFGGGVSH